jgi:hypothetical protein
MNGTINHEEIARELGSEWSVLRKEDQQPVLILTAEPAVYLWFRVESHGAKPGRLAIHGNVWDTGEKISIDRAAVTSISVAADAAPARIAAEIKRRLLPSYVPARRAQLAESARQSRIKKADEAQIATWANQHGLRVHQHSPNTASWYSNDKAYGDVQMSWGTCELKLRNLTPELTGRILELVCGAK